MKTLKLLLYFILFFFIGEALIRIDRKYDLLNNAPKKIDTKIEETELLDAIEKNTFIQDSSQVRILVIGDSYIHGGGINSKDKFSKKLSILLNNNPSQEKNFLVLDVSRPSNNTLDNYNSFIYYQEKYNPHIVFWAYNFNDILGAFNLVSNKVEATKVSTQEKTQTAPKQTTKKKTGLKNTISKIYSYSELSRYLSTNLQKELKTVGIVLPLGDFYFLTKKAYSNNNKNWLTTKKLFNDVSQIGKTNKTKIILYNMPEFNLLGEESLFTQIDESLLNYFNSNNTIVYLNGKEDFINNDKENYKLSKYDGHPNTQAHLVIAEKISDYIKNEFKSLQ